MEPPGTHFGRLRRSWDVRFTVRLGLGDAGPVMVFKFPIDDEGGRYGALSYSWNGESTVSYTHLTLPTTPYV